MSRRRLARKVPVIECEPDLLEVQKVVVVRAVQWAWSEVCRQWPEIVAAGREEEVSEKLCRVLNDQDAAGQRLAPGLSEFESVQRGAKVRGSGGGIEYQPDLTFRPFMGPKVRNRGDWGWFVECKVVSGGASVVQYCVSGVQRFIDGRYAARMPSGAMLAYVRDGRMPHVSLQSVMAGAYGDSAVESVGNSVSIVKSRHRRLLAGRDRIELTHLWLDARNN